MDETTLPGQPASTADALRAIDASRLFLDLPPTGRSALAKGARLLKLGRGDRLWTLGDAASGLAMVDSGSIQCWAEAGSRRFVSNVVRAGGAFGLAAAVDGGATTCNADAQETTRVMFVPSASLREAMATDGDVARAVAAGLAAEFRRLLLLGEDLTLRTPLQRLAHYLDQAAGPSDDVELNGTQSAIAGQIGTVREVVGRAFHRLEELGVVVRRGRLVRILRRDELRNLAAGAVGAA